jgi:hypothetical protein
MFERFRHAPDNRQAEAEAGGASAIVGCAALEFFEYALTLSRSNAGAGVPNFD